MTHHPKCVQSIHTQQILTEMGLPSDMCDCPIWQQIDIERNTDLERMRTRAEVEYELEQRAAEAERRAAPPDERLP